MHVITTRIPEVLLFEPKVYGDERGYFYESYNQRVLAELAGIRDIFVQDNHSRSRRHVLRGLHYQIRQPQGKLVRVIEGTVFDVAVDIRRRSSMFGTWVGFELSEENHRSAWIPAGFAHGFVVLSEYAQFLYKTTDFWAPEYERTIIWNDVGIGVQWPLSAEPILSAKDRDGVPLDHAELFE